MEQITGTPNTDTNIKTIEAMIYLSLVLGVAIGVTAMALLQYNDDDNDGDSRKKPPRCQP